MGFPRTANGSSPGLKHGPASGDVRPNTTISAAFLPLEIALLSVCYRRLLE
jgi:hypothetical protein